MAEGPFVCIIPGWLFSFSVMPLLLLFLLNAMNIASSASKVSGLIRSCSGESPSILKIPRETLKIGEQRVMQGPALPHVAPGSFPAVEGDIWRPVSEHCACWSPRGPCPRPRRPQHSVWNVCLCTVVCVCAPLCI